MSRFSKLQVLASAALVAGSVSAAHGMTGYLLVSLQPTAASFGIPSGGVWGLGTAWSDNSSGVAAISSYWKGGTPFFGSYPTNAANGVTSGPPYTSSTVLPVASSGSTFAYSGAYGINDNGTQVGIAGTSDTLSSGHAAVWNSGAISVYSGFATSFGTETGSALYAVNNDGFGVGYVAAAGNHAAVYQNGSIALLSGTVKNGQSLAVARGVSQGDIAVGTSQGTQSTLSAYTYDLNAGTVTTIPLPTNVTTWQSGTSTYSFVNNSASGISPAGRYVVGAIGDNRTTLNPSLTSSSGFFSSQVDSLAYIYDTTTGVATALPIGTSGDLATGAAGYNATSVNDSGWVVGTGPNVKSFVYDGTATYDVRQYLVNESVTTQISTLDYIDDNGYIFGSAIVNGVSSVPIVLIPVPEPTSAGLLGLGALGLGLRRRRA